LPGAVYQAVSGFEGHLENELPPGFALWGGGLYYCPSPPEGAVFWKQNLWLKPVKITFTSINDAASSLRAIQRNWSPCFFDMYRRGALIAEKLPPISAKPRPFPWLLPEAPMGAFTLLDEHTMAASAECESPFPGGRIDFAEDKEGPPSRAYLKLWEALTLERRLPEPESHCVDAGASPGGWTWALARLGARVTAIDRAPLDEKAASLPGVSFVKHDAFTLSPEAITADFGPVDWLFSDVVCYPPRLYAWIEKWLASGLCRNFVCTIKMQGPQPDSETTRLLAEVPGSKVVHLWNNKHELTWLKH
jgi:23S rRNA (cytidine2498-2'-O)-methyltransferase